MLAHKVHCWQAELSLAMVTCLLIVKIDCSLLHFGNLTLTVLNLGHFLVLALLLLLDSLTLGLEILKQEVLDNPKRHALLAFEDLKH